MKVFVRWAVPLAAAALIFTAGCQPTDFSVGGKVSGLAGSLSLSLNGTETLAVTKNRNYAFSTRLATAATYNVTVATQPPGQTCSVANGSGTIASANVSNVNVTCTNIPYRVGGLVEGLFGALTIALNGSETLTLSTDGPYQFSTTLFKDNSYEVVIITQPAGQECTVTDGTGNISVSDATVDISCISSDGPSISGVWPQSARSGYPVRIFGVNFGDCEIVFNGTPIEPTLCTDTETRFTVPDFPAGTSSIELANSLGTTRQYIEQRQVLDNVVSMGLNARHKCVSLIDGTVQCWAYESYGTLYGGLNGAVRLPEFSDVTQLSSGMDYSCAVLGGGTVKCWGNGPLGNGSTSSNTPVTVSGINTAVAVSAGMAHSCVVLSSGAVKCWGGDNSTRASLGDGTGLGSRTPVVVTNINNAVAVSAGAIHSCALLGDGQVKCWGAAGLLGIGELEGWAEEPVTVSGIADAISISAGEWRSCAVLSSGAVKCWGDNSFGTLGNGSTVVWVGIPETVIGINNAVSVSVSDEHSCAVLISGEVKCWGQRGLGAGKTQVSMTPVTVNGISNAIAIESTRFQSSPFSTTCALLSGRKVQCWGGRDGDEVGSNAGIRKSPFPVTIAGINNAVSIAAGGHSCVLLGSGAVQCWGSATSGQLGDGQHLPYDWNLPVMVSEISNAVSISNSCAVLSSGLVQCWGPNSFGVLGNGSNTIFSLTPVTVSGINNAVAVSDGGAVRCALDGGEVKCWGYGQLGDGTWVDSAIPVTVRGITNAAAVSAGSHSCAVLATGSVWCWGRNNQGQLGNGSTIDSATPVAVSGISTAVSISVGSDHSCALLSSGEVQCWGSDNGGKLGDGGSERSLTPVTVSGINSAIAVSVGENFSCALMDGGTLKCWGQNSHGQMGDGFVHLGLPVTINGIRNAISISTTFANVCAVLMSGAVQCLGDNTAGQLGLTPFAGDWLVPAPPVEVAPVM